MQESIYSLSVDGIAVQVLPEGGWNEGFYTKEKENTEAMVLDWFQHHVFKYL